MAKSLPLLGDNYAQVGIAIVSGCELSVVPCSLSNPRRMHEGYSSRFMCVCVYLSITTLAATYLFCTSQMRCYKAPYGISNV